MPASIRNAIMRICEENYVVPRRLLPLTDVMAQHVLRSDNSSSANALLVALFDSRIEMVVLNDRGDPLFVRELGFRWNGGEMERLRTDVERTMLFAKQRLSSTIEVVSLMGVEAVEAARHLQPHFNIQLQPDEQSVDASFWAAEVNRLPKRTKTNFIPRSMQRAITSRQLKNAGKRMAVAASLAAAIVVLSVEYFVFLYAGDEHTVDARIGDLEIRYHQLMSEADELDQLEHRLALLTGPTHAFPVILMERLGDLLPDSMVVNRVLVQKQAAGWSFQMSGTNQPTFADTAESLGLLEQRLSEAPWHATVSSTWQDTWLQQLRAGQAVSDDMISFQLDGQLQ